MAQMLRLTGVVGRIDIKAFTYKTGERAGEAGEMRNLRVITGDCEFVDVLLADAVPLPRKGDRVDYSVKVSLRPGRGNFGPQLDCQAVGPYVTADGVVEDFVPVQSAPAPFLHAVDGP